MILVEFAYDPPEAWADAGGTELDFPPAGPVEWATELDGAVTLWPKNLGALPTVIR